MPAPIIAAGVAAAATLIGGLLQAEAQKRENEKQRVFQAQQQAFQTQLGGQRQLGTSQQTALAQLAEQFKGVFL